MVRFIRRFARYRRSKWIFVTLLIFIVCSFVILKATVTHRRTHTDVLKHISIVAKDASSEMKEDDIVQQKTKLATLIHQLPSTQQHLLDKPQPVKRPSQQACVHPKLDINNPQLAKYFFQQKPVQCNDEPDWITIENDMVYITPAIRNKYENIDCEIKYIVRHDDFDTSLTEPINLHSKSKLKLQHDFFTCRCQSNGTIYENVHAGISGKPKIDKHLQQKPGFGAYLNVLILGFDSISHMTFMRKLQHTYKYFTEKLDGIVLNGYNIVGDGTPQALIPILTGKTELELPNVLKTHSPKTYVNVYPMIWKDFEANGYITVYGEDYPRAGTFTYRLNGFDKQPTDHYFRPFHIEADRKYSKSKKYCLGSKRRSRIFFDWYKDVFKTYSNIPKFAFGFHSELSHADINLVETADVDMHSTLEYLNKEGHLNNTVLILMSDHGVRFTKVRATLQGKQEERRPFFGFAFPKWFEKKYPLIIKNMRINSNRLVTPFDIFFTLRDILKYENSTVNKVTSRGMSLFKEIPETRSCEHAHIEAHWCACLEWTPIHKDDHNTSKAAESLLNHLNNLTEPFRGLCAKLNIHIISKAFYLLPKKHMLQFKGSKDIHGRDPDFSDTTTYIEIKYQIWIQTTPGNGHYEATISHNTATNTFKVRTEDISRINIYGSAPKCIEKQHEELRKYCYCYN